MPERLKQIPIEVWIYLKVFFTACISIGVKLAVMAKREPMKKSTVVLTFLIGVGVAMLFGPHIIKSYPSWAATGLISFITVIGDKAAQYFIYDFDVRDWIEKNLTKKK